MEFKVDDFVSYYQGGYRYSGLMNEYGDQDVIDWHFLVYGKVISIVNGYCLIWFYGPSDHYEECKENIWLIYMHCEWIKFDDLEKINEPWEFNYIFNSFQENIPHKIVSEDETEYEVA